MVDILFIYSIKNTAVFMIIWLERLSLIMRRDDIAAMDGHHKPEQSLISLLDNSIALGVMALMSVAIYHVFE